MTGYEFKYDTYDFRAGVEQYERILAGKPAEFIPVTAQISEFCAKYRGYNAKRFYSDPELFVRGNLEVQQEFGFDVPDLVWDVYCIEAEALGGEMAWFDDLCPALDNTEIVIKSERDLARIKAPDPMKAGRMPFIIESLRLMKELTGYTHYIHFCAPISLAAQLMQFEKLIVAIRENPQYVHRVMNFIIEEVTVPYIEAYLKAVPGATTAHGKDAIGSLPFITEPILEEFSVPYILKLRDILTKKYGDRIHVRCDNWWGDAFAKDIEKFWNTKLVATPQYLKVQDPDCFRIGSERARAFADQQGCPLSLGIGTMIAEKGTKLDLQQRVHEYMEVGSRGPHGGTFFLYFCNFSALVPTENVWASIEAVKAFRAGDRPYAGQIFSGPNGLSPETSGGKGFMGIGAAPIAATEDAATVARKPIFEEMYQAVMDFDGDRCAAAVEKALTDGEPVQDIVDQGLIPPMGKVGDLFAAGEFFVPEMLMAAKAMKAGLEILRPIITQNKSKPKGIIVMATVFGDLHDIGKNLVGMMLEGAGFKVVDLGVNVKADRIIETAKQVDADVIGLSALLTTTMPFMRQIIAKIKEEGLDIPVIVGGAPVTAEFADEVGADGYGDNAPEAVDLCNELIAKRNRVAAA